jgi:thioredoxin reductase (NADPH)
MTKQYRTKVLIIGSGPAGYSAAIYAARANLNPIIVAGMEPGGQLMVTTDVENYPGFKEVIQGPWLMEQMRGQVESVGTEIISDMIVDVDLSKRPFKCTGDLGTEYIADTVIISTGASARWLGTESETKFRGFGISACATCDGFFYKNQEVAIIGGGDTAAEEALFLTNFASKVSLIHRRDELRADKVLQDRLFKNDKIEIIWDSVIDEFLGSDNPASLTGIRLTNVKTGAKSNLNVTGAFIAIGHDPATKIFKDKIDMDKEGYLLTAPDSTATNIPGVFAAGDVKDKVYRQAVTAAGMGCMSALEAERFIAEQGTNE